MPARRLRVPRRQARDVLVRGGGLLKMSSDNAQGLTMTFTGVPLAAGLARARPKREPYRYNIQALRKSVVAGLLH